MLPLRPVCFTPGLKPLSFPAWRDPVATGFTWAEGTSRRCRRVGTGDEAAQPVARRIAEAHPPVCGQEGGRMHMYGTRRVRDVSLAYARGELVVPGRQLPCGSCQVICTGCRCVR
jgi:hypothetical protein